MNIQNNTAKQQQTNDYYKELKDIYKELGKLYSQLSKEESFTDILDIIKNEFLKSNISLIEDSLTKPGYKEFNPKVIKILKVIIDILEKHTSFASSTEGKTILNTIDDAIKRNIREKNTPIKTHNDSAETDKIEYFRQSPEELASFIESLTYDNVKQFKTGNEEEYKIIKHLCIFKYYLNIFENNDEYGTELDDKLKKILQRSQS